MLLPSPRNASTPETLDNYAAEGHALPVEAFTLLVFGLVVIVWRAYVRFVAVGLRGFQLDDYLIWLVAIFYCVETSIVYAMGSIGHRYNNSSISPLERAMLDPSDYEYHQRRVGSKLLLACWLGYCLILWCLKIAVLTFYLRLLGGVRFYRRAIFIGFGLIAASFVASVLDILLSCRPLHRMWQISPDPGVYCQPALSPALLFPLLGLNVGTDFYIAAIAIPLLFETGMSKTRRAAVIVLFGCGIFVPLSAVVRTVGATINHDPRLGCGWALREIFVAVVVTNAGIIFQHKAWRPPRSLQSSSPQWPTGRGGCANQGAMQYPGGGGLFGRKGDAAAVNRSWSAPSAHHVSATRSADTERGFRAKQEVAPDECGIKMQTLKSREGDAARRVTCAAGPEAAQPEENSQDRHALPPEEGGGGGIRMQVAVRVSCVEEHEIRRGRPGAVRMGNYAAVMRAQSPQDVDEARRPSMLTEGGNCVFEGGYNPWWC